MFRYLVLAIGLVALPLILTFGFTDQTYSPSIAELEPNESLVMKLSACHSGCTKGTVTFRNNTATVRGHSINLTADEVRNLDEFFLLADQLDDDYFCSARVMIGFKRKTPFRLPVRKKTQLYPCSFHHKITPEELVYHLNETPNETPYWRLPPAERTIIIED